MYIHTLHIFVGIVYKLLVRKSYTNKRQKHIAFGYGYKLVCVNDKFNRPL